MAAERCTAAYNTDEYHGYGCSITEGACMFLYPDSKACAEQYGEGPDAEDGAEFDEEESHENKSGDIYMHKKREICACIDTQKRLN